MLVRPHMVSVLHCTVSRNSTNMHGEMHDIVGRMTKACEQKQRKPIPFGILCSLISS